MTNLLSYGSVPAAATDANFINPWGSSASPDWWRGTVGTGYNYVVPAAEQSPARSSCPWVLSPRAMGFLPARSPPQAPPVSAPDLEGYCSKLFFSTLDGTLSGWNGKLGLADALSQILVNKSATGASYTGLALLTTVSGSFLLASHFTTAAIEVYNSAYIPAKLAGALTDPNLPANDAPFSIHILGTQVFVVYAQRTAAAP